MKKRIHRYLHSAVFNLFFCMIAVLLPVIGFTLYTNYLSRHQALDSIQAAYSNLLQKDIAELDGQLKQIQLFNIDQAFHNSDISRMSYFADSTEASYAKNRVYQELSLTAQKYSCLGTLFIYLENTGQYIDYYGPGVSQADAQQAMEAYLRTRALENSSVSGLKSWELVNLKDTDYLVQMVYNKNICTGSYIPVEHLSSQLSMQEDTGDDFMLVWEDALEETESGLPADRIFISAPSAYGFSLGYTVSQQAVIKNLPVFHRYALMICVFLVAAVVYLLYKADRIVAKPIRFLRDAMNRIRSGDLDYRITEASPYQEYQLLNETFNQTLDEIQDLKIHIYEQQLAAQRSRINNLQMQIKPHFLINSLNMVYNRLINGDLKGAKSLISYTIRYFRFMMKIGDDYITLQEEVEHIQDYIEIQKLRYETEIQLTTVMNSFIVNVVIPPMLLHQFVENSVKYALTPERLLRINLTAEYLEEDCDPYVRIFLQDNGPGFPKELLPSLQKGENIQTEDRGHFGIYNSITQLRFRYKNARWKFFNDEGACVELVIPLVEE